MIDFIYQDPYPILKDDTQYRKITSDFVKVEQFGEREVLTVDPKGLELLAEEALTDVSFMLRTTHLQKLRNRFIFRSLLIFILTIALQLQQWKTVRIKSVSIREISEVQTGFRLSWMWQKNVTFRSVLV